MELPDDLRPIVKSYPLTHIDWWEQREATYEKVTQSNAYMESLGFMEKQVLYDLVRRSLDLARDNIEEWLEDGIQLSEDGDHFVVEFHFLKANVEKKMVAARRLSSRHAAELKAQMEGLFDETIDGEG